MLPLQRGGCLEQWSLGHLVGSLVGEEGLREGGGKEEGKEEGLREGGGREERIEGRRRERKEGRRRERMKGKKNGEGRRGGERREEGGI